MTQAAVVTSGSITSLFGAGNTKASLAGLYSADFIATLWDVPDDVGLGYTWDGTNFIPGVTPSGPLDPATYAAIVSETIETANQLISQSVTAESNSRTQADASLQSQIDGLTRSFPVSDRTGSTSETVVEADRGYLLVFNDASPVAVDLPQAGGPITNGWFILAANQGSGLATLTPATSTINGTSSLAIDTDQTALIISDGTNYTAALISAGGVTSVNGQTGSVSLGASDRAATYLNIDAITDHGDSDLTIAADDRAVVTSASLTNPRAWTIPAASDVNPGQILVVSDLAGGVTSSNTITLTRDGSDTINGGTTLVMRNARSTALLWSDGVTAWSGFVVSSDATNASNLSSGTVPAARGGAGTVNGVMKANGSGVVSAATAGTDYLAPPSGTALLKANSGGALANATAKTDYWDTTDFTGDSGSGGVKGLVPAPASGDAAAAKYLKADGTWAAPAGASQWELIGTTTVTTGVVNVEQTFTADTYSEILVVFSDLSSSSAGGITFSATLRTSSTAVVTLTSGANVMNTSSTTVTTGSATFSLGRGATTKRSVGSMLIHNIVTPAMETITATGTNATSPDRVRLAFSTGNIDGNSTGYVYVYGLKNS